MAKEVFALLTNVNLKFETKLRRAAQMLACTPTFAGVGGALSRLVLCSQEEDNVEKPLQRFECRLCDFGATGERAFLDHVMEKRSGGADGSRALIEYRKKVVGLATHLGPSDAWLRMSEGRALHSGQLRLMWALLRLKMKFKQDEAQVKQIYVRFTLVH